MATKQVTLHELHAWIVESREIGAVEDEGMIDPEDIKITSDSDQDTPADIETVQQAFAKILSDLQDFDCLFHDKFDCR